MEQVHRISSMLCMQKVPESIAGKVSGWAAGPWMDGEPAGLQIFWTPNSHHSWPPAVLARNNWRWSEIMGTRIQPQLEGHRASEACWIRPMYHLIQNPLSPQWPTRCPWETSKQVLCPIVDNTELVFQLMAIRISLLSTNQQKAYAQQGVGGFCTLTDPTSNCRTISPIPAPVTSTVVAQPGMKVAPRYTFCKKQIRKTEQMQQRCTRPIFKSKIQRIFGDFWNVAWYRNAFKYTHIFPPGGVIKYETEEGTQM